MATWRPFPYVEDAYRYGVGDLRARWNRLHAGGCEWFPGERDVDGFLRCHPGVAALAGDAADAAELLQQAWIAYHAGAFWEAVQLGDAVGPLGADVANRATCAYATHLAADEERDALLEHVVARAMREQMVLPDAPGGYYFHALALASRVRHSEGRSAISQELCSRIRSMLEMALQRAPQHADTHLALGIFHAELIARKGSVMGAIGHGVRREKGLEHFETALRLNPESVTVRREFAQGLLQMFGRSRQDEALDLYEQALRCVVADATERLELELVRSVLVQ